MNKIQLNLARKGRPRSFDQIVGQDLAVKMLKNSLYRAHLFPVYLFCGQRGTGKTSMARVFATAINCSSLSLFQKDPKNTAFPCLQCTSCKAMLEVKHPDFIEIDAASNTGVDNVRTIIDQATLLPLMGHKKIYLIDEAHMLSKAAFNALLKILEEPPLGSLFILATTEAHKVIDTVRSRCFQVCFKSVDMPTVTDHLVKICSEESIYADQDALTLIALESEGSLRDAINILERVRFAQGRITRDSVLTSLGHIDDVVLAAILDCIISRNPTQLMQLINDVSFDTFDADYIYKRIIELMRSLILARCGLPIPLPNPLAQHMIRCAQKCSMAQITDMVQHLYNHERLFTKTTGKHLMLEMILLKMCNVGSQPTEQNTPIVSAPCTIKEQMQNTQQVKPIADFPSIGQGWTSFVNQIAGLKDPLLLSIFSNAIFKGHNSETGTIDVAFARQFIFFQDWISNNEGNWKSLLHTSFGPNATLNAVFTDEVAPVATTNIIAPKNEIPERTQPQNTGEKKTNFNNFNKYKSNTSDQRIVRKGPVVDVSDNLKWPKASLVLTHFQGIVRQA